MPFLTAFGRVRTIHLQIAAASFSLFLGCSSGNSNHPSDEVVDQDVPVLDVADVLGDVPTDLQTDLPGETLTCPEGQVAYSDGCGPILPETCGAGEILLTGGKCAAIGPRGCPKLWDPDSQVDCESGQQLPCPEGTAPSEDGSYCVPQFDTCPEGELAQFGGGCKKIGPTWERLGGTEPYFDHCDGSELALLGGGCVAVGPRACEKIWNSQSTDSCEIGELAACPGGWTEESDGKGTSWCEPVYAVCTEGERPLLGGGCQRIVPLAEECPNATYPEAPTGAQILYVNAASGCASGCGSETQPYPTLAEAVTDAAPGTTILVAEGAYAGFLVDKPITIQGICPAKVVISGTVPVPGATETEPQSAALVVAGTQAVTLAGLRIANPGVGVAVVDSSQVTLTGLELQDNVGLGLYLRAAAAVSASQLWIHGTKSSLFVALDGTGIRSVDSQLTLTESLVENNTNYGISSSGTTALLMLTQSTIRGTQYLNSLKGVGVLADLQSTATLDDVVIEKNGYAGLAKNQSQLTLNRCVVRDAATTPDTNELGLGLSAQYGSTLTLAHSLVHDVNQMAVTTMDEGSTAVVTRSVIRDIQTDKLEALGAGAWAQEGGSLDITASILLRCHERAIYLTDSGAQTVPTVTLTGSVITQTLPAGGIMGYGMFVWGGQATLSYSVLSSNREAGAAATSETSVLILQSVSIRDILPSDSGDVALALLGDDGTQMDVTDSLFEKNLGWGAQAFGEGSYLEATGLVVRETSPIGNNAGRGVEAAGGATLVMDSCVVQASTEVGVTAGGTGSVATLTDVTISDTESNGNGQFGFGASVGTGASLTLKRVLLDNNTDLGVQTTVTLTTLIMEQSIIRNTRSDQSGATGLGLQATSGSTVTMTECLVTGNRGTGISASSATVTVIDSVVEKTLSTNEGKLGVGLEVQQSGHLILERSLVQKNRQVGLNVGHSGSLAEVRHTLIRETESDAAGSFGMGVQVNLGASVTLTDVVLDKNRQIGILVGKINSNLKAERTTIVNTKANDYGLWGQGIQVLDGAVVTCSGCLASGNTQAGVTAFGAGTKVVLSGTMIRDTLLDTDGESGMGLAAAAGSSVTLNRTGILGSNTVGMFATNALTVVKIYNSWIQGTAPGKSKVYSEATGTVITGTFGDGVMVDNDAHVVVSRTIVRGNSRAAIYYHAATGSLEGSLLIGNGGDGLALGAVDEGKVTYGTTEPNVILGNMGKSIEKNSTMSTPHICIPPGCTDFIP